MNFSIATTNWRKKKKKKLKMELRTNKFRNILTNINYRRFCLHNSKNKKKTATKNLSCNLSQFRDTRDTYYWHE